jgi:uncharacterized protein involved in exopolysaccharide biosynthesis
LESDLFSYVRPILRWSWVTIILVISTVAAISYYNANVPVVYDSGVKLQISAPEPDEVGLFTTVKSGTTRDEITAIQNDLQPVARGLSAADMTIKQLGLTMTPTQLANMIWVEIPAFSDFVIIHAQADNPNDAAAIATAQTDNTITLYGEYRARSAQLRRQFIVDQMDSAGKVLADARDALLRFQTKNGVVDLARDIQTQQDTIRSLSQDRDRDMVEIERATAAGDLYTSNAQTAEAGGDLGGATSYRNQAIAQQAIVEGMRAAVTRLNELIAQKQNDLQAMVALSSEYDRIQQDLGQAEGNYNFLLGKLNEAQIKESDALQASYIQIVEPANVATRSIKASSKSMLIPGIAAAIIGGIVLSYILEFAFGFSRRKKARPDQ